MNPGGVGSIPTGTTNLKYQSFETIIAEGNLLDR
jgi:hypothetical protein|nr:MAG: hypothetical protein [Bacteriophage sp.]UVX59448.1 MAG: hypothetical protein [Bacteriophage sp.]UWG93466.1 MAG: hypothetical protein [Bacteriophage sp.]DAW94039.1 MAG TPA: hypothetical protein [Caudoviricetes sp.]